MKYKKILSCVALIGGLLLSGCAKNVPPGEYDAAEVGKIKKVVPGVIISKRPVNIRGKSADNGVVPGEEATVTRNHGFEYVIKLNSGAVISVVQTENLDLKSKQHILVIYGENTRVVADDGSED